MTLCLGMCLAGPAAAWMGVLMNPIGEPAGNLMQIGPLMETHILSSGGGAPPTAEQWQWILILALASVAAWGGLSLALLARRRRSADHAPPR